MWLSLILLSGVSQAGISIEWGSNGQFKVVVGDADWFVSEPAEIRANDKTYNANDLACKPLDPQKGNDAMGDFTGHVRRCVLPSGERVDLTVRLYPNDVVFEQHWLDGAKGTAQPGDHKYTRNDISGGFPKLRLQDGSTKGYQTFSNTFEHHLFYGTWDSKLTLEANKSNSTYERGQIIVFEEDMSNTMIISPCAEFMSWNGDVVDGLLTAGPLGSIASIPKGYRTCTMLAWSDQGVRGTIERWGQALLNLYGKSQASRDKDWTLNYLGYSTDNGAYYYYKTENHTNYEVTMIDIAKEAKRLNVPVKYWLLDSWWYYKDHVGAVTEWEAKPDIFPHGLEYLYNQTEMLVMAHNRYWSQQSNYSKANGGKFDFIDDPSTHYAWPVQQAF